jgi:hypothetical protein
MSRWTTTLERQLEELVRLNERLLGLAEARLEAMKGRDAARLEALLVEERRVSLAIFAEERRRQTTMIHLAGELGKRPEELPGLRLSDMAALLPEPQRGRLLLLRDRLRAVAQQTEGVNQTAACLAQRCLPHFEELLGILLEGTIGQPAYTAEGQSVRAGSAGLSVLDVRA